MFRRPWFFCLPIAALLGMVVSVPSTASDIKIYIETDLEGVSGVYTFDQTRHAANTPPNDQAKEYFMGDLAAVIRGLRDAGVGEITVLDNHGSGAIIPHLMEPGAKYLVGKNRPSGTLQGLDKTYSGLILFGHHAMMGTPDGVLHHTRSSKNETRVWYNGVESGELAQLAAIAGYYGVPPIMVTGDEATCRESKKFFGDECVTVAVKKGITREFAVLYPFAETRKALYEGAKRAVAAIPCCKPYQLTYPVHAKKQWLVFDKDGSSSHLETKEGTIPDALHLWNF